MSFKILIFILMTSQTISSFTEFCESNYLKSIFSIDRDMYFVSFKNNQNMIWKFDFKSNSVFIDNKMNTFVEKIGFDVNYPILGFKFTEVYECSKDKNRCKDKNYTFEDFENCNKSDRTLNYCRNQTQLEDMVFLIGFDNQSKQSYRAVKQNNLDFEVISDKDMPFGWPANSQLSLNTFIPIDSEKEVIVGLIYNRDRHQLAMILESKGKFELKEAFLQTFWWFHYWKTYPYVPNKQFVGLVEKNSQIFAITAIDDFIYLYEDNELDFNEKLLKQKFRFKDLINCSSVSDVKENLVSIDFSQRLLHQINDDLSYTGNESEILCDEEMAIPATNPMLYLIIPLFTIVTVTAICSVYFCFCRPKAEQSQMAASKHKEAIKHVFTK